MSRTFNSTRKLCKVMTNGPIAELGFINGPIVNPCRLELRKIVNMVHRGLVVYEVNPKNYSEEVRLTIENITTNNFPEEKKVIMPAEKEEKKDTPVVDKTNVQNAVQDNNIQKKSEPSKLDDAIAAASYISPTIEVDGGEGHPDRKSVV